MNAPRSPVDAVPGLTPARKRWHRTPGGIVAICTAVALALLTPVAIFGAQRNATSPASPAQIDSCSLTGTGPTRTATIGYAVTNSGRRTRSYVLRFEVLDYNGARVGDDVEYVNDVAPGQVVRGEAVAALAGTGARCGLVDWS